MRKERRHAAIPPDSLRGHHGIGRGVWVVPEVRWLSTRLRPGQVDARHGRLQPVDIATAAQPRQLQTVPDPATELALVPTDRGEGDAVVADDATKPADGVILPTGAEGEAGSGSLLAPDVDQKLLGVDREDSAGIGVPTLVNPGTASADGSPDLPVRIDPSTIYSRADDYGWVQGTLTKVHSRGGYWQIRYASFDQVDEHGGNFILVGSMPSDVSDGDVVMVEGRIEGYDKKLNGAKYNVHFAKLVHKGGLGLSN